MCVYNVLSMYIEEETVEIADGESGNDELQQHGLTPQSFQTPQDIISKYADTNINTHIAHTHTP